MNRLILGIACLGLGCPLFGDVDYDDTPSSSSGGHQYSVHGQFDCVGKADFDEKPFKGQNVSYKEAMGYASMVWYYDAIRQQGAYALLGYTYTKVDWKENPFADQDDFKEINIGLGFFTKHLCDWEWQLRGIANIDTEHDPIGRYTNYDLLMWGKYHYGRCLALHCGLCAYTGMRTDWVYPIFGADWKVNRKWKINAIFPLDLSVVYSVTPQFTAALAARFFRSRHRVGKKEPLPQALIQYQNTGIELKLNYDWNDCLSIDIHGGSALGGRLKVSNKKNHNAQRLDLKKTGYIGAEATFSF